MSEVKPLSFHIEEGFTFLIGKEQKEIKVPRLEWKNAERVISVVARIMAEDYAQAIETQGAGVKAQVAMDKELFHKHAELIRKVIPSLIASKNFKAVKEVLEAVSQGVIKEKEFEIMQFEEAAMIAAYLLNSNFGVLKNFEASIAAFSATLK